MVVLVEVSGSFFSFLSPSSMPSTASFHSAYASGHLAFSGYCCYHLRCLTKTSHGLSSGCRPWLCLLGVAWEGNFLMDHPDLTCAGLRFPRAVLFLAVCPSLFLAVRFFCPAGRTPFGLLLVCRRWQQPDVNGFVLLLPSTFDLWLFIPRVFWYR